MADQNDVREFEVIHKAGDNLGVILERIPAVIRPVRISMSLEVQKNEAIVVFQSFHEKSPAISRSAETMDENQRPSATYVLEVDLGSLVRVNSVVSWGHRWPRQCRATCGDNSKQDGENMESQSRILRRPAEKFVAIWQGDMAPTEKALSLKDVVISAGTFCHNVWVVNLKSSFCECLHVVHLGAFQVR